MLPEPELDAETATVGGKCAFGATIPWNCLEKVIWAAALLDLIPLLGVIAGPAEVLVDQSRNQLLGDDGLERTAASDELAGRMFRGVENRPPDGLRSKYRWHRLRLSRHAIAHDIELRSVDRGQLDHGQVDGAPVVNQLGSE